jgi:hypothetical protein
VRDYKKSFLKRIPKKEIIPPDKRAFNLGKLNPRTLLG